MTAKYFLSLTVPESVASGDYQRLCFPCRSGGVRLTGRGVRERLGQLMVHLFVFFIQNSRDHLAARLETPKRRRGSMVTAVHRASPGDRGAVQKSETRKRGKD